MTEPRTAWCTTCDGVSPADDRGCTACQARAALAPTPAAPPRYPDGSLVQRARQFGTAPAIRGHHRKGRHGRRRGGA